MEIEKFRNERIFALSDMNASLIRGAPECGWEWGVDGRNEPNETCEISWKYVLEKVLE